MGAPFVIYHNPRCSKSRQALEILRAHKVEPQIIEYLKTPPDAMTLKDVLRKLKLGVRDILRDGEDEYAKLKLNNPNLSGDKLIATIIKHPVLLQRPIVVCGHRAVIGRPPEKVKELL
ncbi:MAG: arsenate reductase (glutaredoxin) [Verrucomicrobiae bacterium]|nr:arsenate reductase (glutaredoxin) [Verrucomicrobiae bacterium]